ncbi:MAG: MFS transporter [Adhaeribacter sp.]
MDSNKAIHIGDLAYAEAGQVYPKKIYRMAVGAMFFFQGLSFASWASRIPSIQQTLGLNEAALGAMLLALPVGLMLSLPFAGWLISRVGSRKVVITAALAYSGVLVSLGFAQNTLQLASALFVYGFFGNLLNIAINTQAVGVEALYKKSIMASFHGLWSLAGFSGAAIGTLMIGLQILPAYHFLLVMALIWVGVAFCARYILREDLNSGENQPLFAKPDKSLVNLGIIAFCSMICEGAMFDWSGVYFKKVVMAEPAWLGAGYTAFMLTMALGRFVADSFTHRFGLKNTLKVSGLLTAAGLILAVVLPGLWTAIAGFLLVGAGVSSVVPLVYSAAGRSKVLSPGVALAAVSTIGFLGFLIGPPLIGFVAGAFSLRASFALIAVMGLCVTLVSSRSKF